jgi:hypothetical protein
MDGCLEAAKGFIMWWHRNLYHGTKGEIVNEDTTSDASSTHGCMAWIAVELNTSVLDFAQ